MFVTREPISIFSKIENVKDEEKKEKLEQLLETLKKNLPEGFKIGAAIGKGDCFFDSVAQGLNELKDKDLITGGKGFSVKYLQKSCKRYAQVNQSEKGSGLSITLKEESEKLCEYILCSECTMEDIENADSGPKIKIQKLENTIWGRPEVEGKMICKKYGIKIKIIELRDEDVDGLHVTKAKVGKGNNIIYIVNYRNHFVPLLSNIEKDINRSVKVSRDEMYGNVANKISHSYISTPLQGIKNSLHKQSSHSKNPGKENCGTGRKRGHSVTGNDTKAPKRACMDINATSNEDSEYPSGLQAKSGQNKLHNSCETKQYMPHHFIELMYRLDLSVLCSLRKSMYECKYPSLSLMFGDSEINKFNDIVICYKEKFICIEIKNVDKYYKDNISYARLFSREKESFFINDYFDSFVEYLISDSKSDSLLNKIEYLIIYTNSGLGLTKEKKFKRGRSKNFYPFQFYNINMKECNILRDFLFTKTNVQGCGFYQFLQDKTTREELSKRLELSSAMQKVIKERKLSQEEIKQRFLDKLLFAVNQPNREELNNIVKSEIEKIGIAHGDYAGLQEKVLRDLKVSKKQEKLEPNIIYEFYLLMLCLHDLFLHKNIFSVNFERKSNDASCDITLHYKNKITCIKALTTDSNIGYSQLFSSRRREKKNAFSINKLFTEELEKDRDIEYFIIYIIADLSLTEEKRFKKDQSKDFYPLKFDNIDIQKKKYKILKCYSCINTNSLYQISQKEITKVSSLLKLPPILQKEKEEGKLSDKIENEIKENFLGRLVFAVNQPNREKLNSIVKNEIHKSDVPYNYEELHEIVLCWLESYEFGPITREMMGKLLGYIKNNRFNYQKIQSKNIDEEIKFAKSLVGREGTSTFNQFLYFLTKGDGIKYLEVLKRAGINLSNVSNILSGAGTNAAKAFKDLYNLWFDEQGQKTQYLKTLENEGMNLSNMSSALGRAGPNAVKAFKDLYDLWFDEQGNKTKYLKTLEEKEVNLSSVSSILSGAKANAAKAFKGLYDLWFDKDGNKTNYLKTLEKEGINLSNISSILSGARANAAKAFKDLYDLWFDEQGNKTQYLKTLEKEGINLSNISSILSGARANAPKAFKDLYDLWFDAKGGKTQCLKTLEKEGINLSNMSSILSGAAVNAAKAFKDLYDLWFDEKESKTHYLKTMEKEGVNLSSVSNILHRAGNNAAKSFKGLYDLWFDAEENKTQYLRILEKEGINLSIMSSILGGAGGNAPKSFKNLYDLWFNAEGNKTQYLNTLEKEGINISNISGILGRAGVNASKAFIELYNTFFDEQGNKKQHLMHFIKEKDGEKRFTMHNISSILGGAGTKAKSAFENLHSVCFNDRGKRTDLLDDFYKAGFRPSNLSCMLCRSGVRASSLLKKLHSVCFNEKREKTKLLNDFYNAGFSPYDLCNILSAAADSLEKFHDFCFIGETKKYLSNFLSEKEGFTLSGLCNILHGAKAKVCSALKDFHDVCFYERGNKTQLLADFCKAGFSASDLSCVLSMAGNNAASILKSFHESCFNENNYLNHFLKENKIFKPKNLSKVLYGVGINICLVFEKLHNLCFDEAGRKKSYLNNLIRDNPTKKIPYILYEKVRGASPTPSN